MEYKLHRRPRVGNAESLPRPRVVPPRPHPQLRKGGGRKDSPGWTEHKRKASRDRFHALRPFIKTGVTIYFPSDATPDQLKSLNDCSRNFCKENGIPARCIWEGPNPHYHIALGIEHDPVLEAKWRKRVARRWIDVFGQKMDDRAFLWKPEVKPNEIASYFSKTRKKGKMVKGGYSWLAFCPHWETGFRVRQRASNPVLVDTSSAFPRKNSVTPSAISAENEGDKGGNSPEKSGEMVCVPLRLLSRSGPMIVARTLHLHGHLQRWPQRQVEVELETGFRQSLSSRRFARQGAQL